MRRFDDACLTPVRSLSAAEIPALRLNLALAVYPEAQVDVEGPGLALHPSAPAVPKAEAKRLGIG